jgi:hypothetical protein
MADKTEPPKVVDLNERRLKKARLQSQAEYIDKLCHRCEGCIPQGCSEADVRRLTEIQRQIILDLLGEDKPQGERPEDEEPKG